MDKGPCQLYQTLVKSPVGTPVSKPQILKHFMGLKKELPIETTKKREIMRIQLVANIGLEHRGYLFTFVAHGGKLTESSKTSNLALWPVPLASFIHPAAGLGCAIP